MARIFSFLVGICTGIVVDQNFEIPKVPGAPVLVEYLKSLTDSKKK